MLLRLKDTRSELLAPAGSFSALMDLYERNYMLVRRLIPEIPLAGVGDVSRVEDGLDLHLSVQARHSYTSDFCLTYRFQRADTEAEEPALRVRIYHDARAAEVMGAHLRHLPAFSQLNEHGHADLRERWRINRFLYKWLGYCLHQGHRFAPKS
jgi:hypothetical protein